ncbi:MAG TPA: SulP family inorganic anion transporter [Gemmata sp.]|nr:SulP family inorganic anion transporter [Gemmata sp.]
MSTPDSGPPPTGFFGAVCRWVPAIDSLRSYTWSSFGRDLTAGITVATVAVPQAMAYALLAGLPPEYGLYTAIVMTAVGALLDSSRLLINGPTNAISIALLSALVMMPESERVPAAVLMAFMVGAVQIGIAFLRLGDLTRYVSHSVIVGFTFGAGSLIVLSQAQHILGQPTLGKPSDHFLRRFWLSLTGSPIHWPTLAVGLGTVLLVLLVREGNRLTRKRGFRFPIPQHLVAVILMAAAVWAFQLDQEGVKIVGTLPASLPAFRLPTLDWEQVRLQAGNAFAIALLGLLEALAMAKAIAARTRQKLDVNQQCLSEGAANFAGSFFQCFPGSGSLTRSAVNQQARAVSQWSGVFAAIAVAITVLFFAPFARYIPRASLAGLLILAAYRMIDRGQLMFHLRATRFDAGVVIATALAALLISIEFCIVIGVFLSFVLYVPRAAKVELTRLTPPEGTGANDGEAVAFGLEGELFFGAGAELEKHFAAMEQGVHENVRVVVLALHRGRNPDATILTLLKSFEDALRARGISLILCGVDPGSEMMKALVATGLDSNVRSDIAPKS